MKPQLLILVIATSFVMMGCAKKVTQEEYDTMESNYQQQVSELEAKVASQQEYIEAVNSSIEDLRSNVNRFEYEDWRDVVPDVYQKAKDLETNIQTEP